MEKVWIKRITEGKAICRCCHYWPATGVWQFPYGNFGTVEISLCDKCADMDLAVDLHDRVVIVQNSKEPK